MQSPIRSPSVNNREMNENDALKAVHGIYLHTIAEKIKEDADIQNGEFRKPIDTPAYRIANEYVAAYLTSHLMANTFDIVSKEADNYVRQRHDEAWIIKKLCLDETRDIFDQLMELCVSDKSSTTLTTNSVSGRKMKPKVTRRGLGGDDSGMPDTLQSKTQTTGDFQFIESKDFSQFTGVLTTNAGAEYTAAESTVPLTGLTFTELGSTTETIETTYDPRGVKAKPKGLPKITKGDLEHSAFKANDFTTMGTAIDTMATEEMSTATTESYLKPVPREKPEKIDETWEELERTQDDTTLNLGICPFKKDFEDIVARKKKYVSMSVQATGKAQIEPNFAPAPPLNPLNFQQMNDNEDDPSKEARRKLNGDMLQRKEDELEP